MKPEVIEAFFDNLEAIEVHYYAGKSRIGQIDFIKKTGKWQMDLDLLFIYRPEYHNYYHDYAKSKKELAYQRLWKDLMEIIQSQFFSEVHLH